MNPAWWNIAWNKDEKRRVVPSFFHLFCGLFSSFLWITNGYIILSSRCFRGFKLWPSACCGKCCRNWNHLGVPSVMGDPQVTMRFSTHHVGISIWTSQFCGHITHVYPQWSFDGSSLGKGLGCLGVFLASNWLTKCRGISLVAETIARSLKFGSQLTCEKTPGSHIYPLDVSNRIFFRFRKASIQQM